MPGRHTLGLSFSALRRNRLQTSLALVGVMIGVAALISSLALGRGAQAALRDQLLAAGANMIVVTAGNYQVESTGSGDVQADHAQLQIQPSAPAPLTERLFAALISMETQPALRYALYQHDPVLEAAQRIMAAMPASDGFRAVHFEDDPFAEHDHPTASERLGDAMAGLGAAATLTREDARAILADVPGVQFVASGVHERARLVHGSDSGKQWFTRLHGTEAELPRIRRGWNFPHGRFFTAREVANAEQVMVLGRVAADRLFGPGVDPVGETIVLWNQPFSVRGVVGSSSWMAQPMPGDDQFDAVYVPVTTVHRLLNLSKLNTITVTTASAGDTTLVAREITALLRQRHGINDAMPDDFKVRTLAQERLGGGLPPGLARVVGGNLADLDNLTIEQLSLSLEKANRTMLSLLAGVAAVSLLVGGIGVTNLQLLSVTQRTREVGLRMALGARRSDIAWQFLLEAVLLAVVGGLLGILLGVLAAGSLEELFQWSTEISPVTSVMSLLVAVLLGACAGVYPARRAARLDPIGALHHE